MITNTITGQGVGNLIAFHLITVIAAYALLILAARRSWLKPNELWLITGAMMFWAVAWLLQPVIPIVRTRFPDLTQAVSISLVMITPILIAMLFGVSYVKKMMEKKAAEPSVKKLPTSPKASRKSR